MTDQAISTTERNAPGSRSRWGDLHTRWLEVMVTWSNLNNTCEDIPDEEDDRVSNEEDELVRQMIATRARTGHEVLQKLTVLEKYLEGNNWYDRRDWLLLASVKRDVAELWS